MKTTSLVPWFGTNRMTAMNVGDELRGLEWLGIPFAGGMSELAHVSCRSIVVNDIHRHLINLATVVAEKNDAFAFQLALAPFHPDVLQSAQEFCVKAEVQGFNVLEIDDQASLDWAYAYFICCWMGRSAKAGTEDEFKGGLSTRWTSSGGDSNTRYRSAIESLEEWQKIMQRCNFTTVDFREFLSKCKDQPKHGIYCDPPFPDAKDKYKHGFTENDHRDLAGVLRTFKQTRVVLRYYDHPLIREQYPESKWTWRRFDGRKQSNEAAPEVLITNGS
jgi:DNA adenine methylase